MSIIQAIILGLAQGLTEFIPVSSSGHLLLLHNAFGISETGLGFDIALHTGTLAALLLFFYKDILGLIRDAFLGGPRQRLAWIIALATVPGVIAGMVLQDRAETTFRSPLLVCLTLSVVAVIMILAEKYGAKQKETAVEEVTTGRGLLVGLAQAIAVVPGISRSGATITTGLFAGLDRVTATRFSFLLSVPITLGAVLKVMTGQDTLQQIGNEPIIFIVGILTAFASGIIAIRFLLKFVAKHSLNVFAYYRLALAAITVLLLISL